MGRPLKFESDAIQLMTDSELERLSYNLRKSYADALYTDFSANGRINITTGSTDGTLIGAALNTRRFEQVATETAAPGNTFPAFPGMGTSTVTYTYKQLRTYPDFPSDATLDSDGFVFYDSDGNGTLRIQTANTADRLYDEVITHCLNEMGTGDKVGTYAIATANPSTLSVGSTGAEDGTGTPGTWTSMGNAFIDSRNTASGDDIFGFGGSSTIQTTFYYLKRNVSTPPGSETSPLPLGITSDGNLKQRNITVSDGIITNVLLPALKRRMIPTVDGVGQSLIYELSSSVNSDPSLIQRGLFTDTARNTEVRRYKDGSNFYTEAQLALALGSGRGETYFSYSTPNNSITGTINTYRLYLRIDTN